MMISKPEKISLSHLECGSERDEFRGLNPPKMTGYEVMYHALQPLNERMPGTH